MHHSAQPLVSKIFNLVAPGPDLSDLTVEALLSQARRRSGLNRFADEDFLKGLEVFVTSVSQSGGLHAFGTFYLRQLVIAMLVHRLKLTELLDTHPEILQERIKQPLFVLGLPRSGTTLLFNLLAQDPGHRFMFNWEAFIAQVPPSGNYTFDNDPRRKQAKWVLRLQKYLMPELDKLHEFTFSGSEECTPILMQSFATQALAGGFDVPAYSSWLDSADHAPTYRHHKRALQALQWKYPAERWLLKSPDHLAALDSLMEQYPDARFIHIHRDPIESVTSWASLNLVYRELYYPQIDTGKLGAQVLNRLANDMDRYMSLRAKVPIDQVYDVQYKALKEDPIKILEDVYRHFGFNLTSETRASIRDYLSENPEHKHGVHNYRPEDFGLTGEVIRQRFTAYIGSFLDSVDLPH